MKEHGGELLKKVEEINIDPKLEYDIAQAHAKNKADRKRTLNENKNE